MMYIDGANLQGVAKTLELRFASYGSLIQHIFQASADRWSKSFVPGQPSNARLVRAYLYSIGSMDEWNLEDLQSLSKLRSLYDRNPGVNEFWLRLAEHSPSNGDTRVSAKERAWQLYLEETRRWYEAKVRHFDGVQRFLHGVETETAFVEVNRDGHWKIDLLRHTVAEKGVDTGFSVAMATMTNSYDVAVLVSGDSDGIPSIKHAKRDGRQVGIVEFYRDSDEGARGPNLSKALRREADFVAEVSDRELLESNVATYQLNQNQR